LFRDIPQDRSSGNSTDDKDGDISRPESVDNESLLDVEEVEDLLDQSSQGVNISEKDSTKQTQENDTLTNANTTGKLLLMYLINVRTVNELCNF